MHAVGADKIAEVTCRRITVLQLPSFYPPLIWLGGEAWSAERRRGGEAERQPESEELRASAILTSDVTRLIPSQSLPCWRPKGGASDSWRWRWRPTKPEAQALGRNARGGPRSAGLFRQGVSRRGSKQASNNREAGGVRPFELATRFSILFSQDFRHPSAVYSPFQTLSNREKSITGISICEPPPQSSFFWPTRFVISLRLHPAAHIGRAPRVEELNEHRDPIPNFPPRSASLTFPSSSRLHGENRNQRRPRFGARPCRSPLKSWTPLCVPSTKAAAIR